MWFPSLLGTGLLIEATKTSDDAERKVRLLDTFSYERSNRHKQLPSTSICFYPGLAWACWEMLLSYARVLKLKRTDAGNSMLGVGCSLGLGYSTFFSKKVKRVDVTAKGREM